MKKCRGHRLVFNSSNLTLVLILFLVDKYNCEVEVSDKKDESSELSSFSSAFLSLFEPFERFAGRTRAVLRDLELDTLLISVPFSKRDLSNIKFYLFTQDNPDEPEILKINETESILNSNFNPDKKTKILVHGYFQSLNSLDFPQRVKNAYLEMGNRSENLSYNIVGVDWSEMSKELLYTDSVGHTKIVGVHLAQFIQFLHQHNFISNFSHVHLIGFSLGAHVSGIAGNEIRKMYGNKQKIGRITGLDPAGPSFSDMSTPIEDRLDESDGEWVDVIHSNGGSLVFGNLGTLLLSGHVDFYPNGGRRQPDCSLAFFKETSIPRRSSCHHIKAVDFFAKSILEPMKYLGVKCESWESFSDGSCMMSKNRTKSSFVEAAPMGEICCSRKSRGKFYLNAS